MENTPAQINNYATSATINMPLHELDTLRADFMKANATIAKLEKSQSQVIITHKKEVVEVGYSYDEWGDRKDTQVSKHLEDAVFVNMDEVLKDLKSGYQARLNQGLRENELEYDRAISQKEVEYKEYSDTLKKDFEVLKTNLHAKYNGDQINLLNSELEEVHKALNEKIKIVSEAEDKVVQLQSENDFLANKCNNMQFKLDQVDQIKSEYLDHVDLNVFERFIKGYYMKLDKMFKKIFSDEKS